VQRAKAGWQALDLPPRWLPQRIGAEVDAVFAARFARGAATARPVQVAAIEAASAMPRPAMVVVEAPMGEGKTEAALLAAEVLATRSGADGCFVALHAPRWTQCSTGAPLAEALPGLPSTWLLG
jgi:CRISPR-associated endonuclease/helicase Cas3